MIDADAKRPVLRYIRVYVYVTLAERLPSHANSSVVIVLVFPCSD